MTINLTKLPRYQEAVAKFTEAVGNNVDSEQRNELYAAAMSTMGEELLEVVSEASKKEAEELKLKYKNEGEAIAMPIFESAERKVSSIKDIGEDKLKSVVDMIVERIVNSNGNS